MRTIRTVQWNIGGGKIRHPEADAKAPDAYTEDGLSHIIDFLGKHDPDVIFFQGTHEKDGHNQVKTIAEALGYESQVNDPYGKSHVEKGCMLGQGIISRFPMVSHTSETFTNPRLTTMWNGREIPTPDKGVTSALLQVGSRALFLAQTLHPIPFKAFGIDPSDPKGRLILEDMETRILKAHRTHRCPSTLQGDFNIDTASLRPFFPKLFRHGFREVKQYQTTRPVPGRFDHVLFSGITAITHMVHSDALTDHYPITAELAFIPQ